MSTEQINTNLMVPHPKIQRDPKDARVRKIAREFNSDYLSVFHVVNDLEGYLVVDGQHRLAAIQKLQAENKLGDIAVDCVIIPSEIAKDDNALKLYFDKVNESYKLSQEDKFRVEEKVGQESTIRARDAADEIGYSLAAKKTAHRTLAYGAWKDAFFENEENAKKALRALHNAYLPRGNFTMAVFTSVFEFVNTLDAPLDFDRLVRGLKFVGADELNNRSRGKNRTVNGRKAVQDAYENS